MLSKADFDAVERGLPLTAAQHMDAARHYMRNLLTARGSTEVNAALATAHFQGAQAEILFAQYQATR